MAGQKRNQRFLKRALGILPGVVALSVLAGSPASAAQWDYNIKTKDGNPGGQAIGRVYYKSSGSCYKAGIDGYLYDKEADGYSVIVYLRGRSCRTGKFATVEAGYVAGKGKHKYYNSGYYSGIKNATAMVCLYKNGRDYYCRTA